MNLNLQQTVFQIEKLKNVVNVGRSSPYCIYTFPGKPVGLLGEAVDPSRFTAANDSNFELLSSGDDGQPSPASWIRRALAALN